MKLSRFSKNYEASKTKIGNVNYADELSFPDGDYLASLPPAMLQKPDLSTEVNNPKKKKRVSIAALMDEKLEEGINIPISETNIGFKMLKKIGYIEGEGLGKDCQGIINPVTIRKRASKSMVGLGVEEEYVRKRYRQDMEMKEKEARKIQLKNDFVSMNSRQSLLRRLQRDVESAKKSIYELDIQSGVQFNELWPSVITSEDQEPNELSMFGEIEMDEDPDIVGEHLRECLMYLKETYTYCYYCGARFNDSEDMANNCPGLLEEDH
mmetsp:Transcript_32100/g.43991  ORF Transcript_32100/g.43991 Transcript_32100/m.43991 type:complete len:266 (-) Transcript_32100:120-917(-)